MTNKIAKHSTEPTDETDPIVARPDLTPAEIKAICAFCNYIMSRTRYKIIYRNGVPIEVPVNEKEIGA